MIRDVDQIASHMRLIRYIDSILLDEFVYNMRKAEQFALRGEFEDVDAALGVAEEVVLARTFLDVAMEQASEDMVQAAVEPVLSLGT